MNLAQLSIGVNFSQELPPLPDPESPTSAAFAEYAHRLRGIAQLVEFGCELDQKRLLSCASGRLVDLAMEFESRSRR